MNGFCLGIALGVAQAALPAETIDLGWRHSVEKVQWTERYRIEAGRLVLAEASVQGSGAGMEPPAGAVFDGKAWRYRPPLPPLQSVTLTRSSYTADYRLCWNGSCRTLSELIGPPRQEGETALLFPCP